MKIIHKIGIIAIFLVALATGIFWLAPDSGLEKGMVIVTAVPSATNLTQVVQGADNRYIQGAQIIALKMDPGIEMVEPVLLTEEFYSARAPEISYNGEKMTFSGQKSKGDTWNIYSMDLKSFEVSQITFGNENCTDPTWLPDGRIAFSMENDDVLAGPVHRLYACEQDGKDLKQLTFNPNSSFESSVFQDGRIIVIDEQKYPQSSNRKLMALRTDGTKSELFYESEQEAEVIGKVWEAGEKVYFIERDHQNSKKASLVSVNQGHPLSSFKNLTENISGEFNSLSPGTDGHMFVSYREKEDQTFGLRTFDLKKQELTEVKYSNPEFHIIEPVLISVRQVPMKLPEIVDESKDKGKLLCLNADLSMGGNESLNEDSRKTAKVQIFGLNEMIGEVPVEADGSFYIEIDANIPVRFQTVDDQGEVLRGPSSWIWVRPNEKRSCMGCHEDRELSPENKVPDALYAGMTKLPKGDRTEAIIINGKEKRDEE